ncbi:MAG TPA: hypothetical protein VIX73_09275 [Kofleriaceae bacterium]
MHDEPRDWLSWSIAGTGVAALGASGVLFYQGARLNSQARSELDARARNELYDRASTRYAAGAAIGVGGLVLTTVGVVKLVLRSRQPASSSAMLDIGFSGHSVFVLGQF